MTDDLVARLPDAPARRLPDFIRTLRINREKRRESVYASDNVYALLDALDAAEARARELEVELAATEAERRTAVEEMQRYRDRLSTIEAETIERCAELADCYADECDAASFSSTVADQVSALRSKEQAAREIAAAIRQLAKEVKHEVE